MSWRPYNQSRAKGLLWLFQTIVNLQRPILNFAQRGKLYSQGWNCPPGVNFVPLGWSYSLGVKFFVRPSISILLNIRDSSPLGVNEGVNIPPREQSSPLGAKFTPGGKPCCYKLASDQWSHKMPLKDHSFWHCKWNLAFV
jgi:hypothetical protein